MRCVNPTLKRSIYQIYGKFLNPTPYKKYCFLERLRSGAKPKKILFYPARPSSFYTIYKICHILGCRITNDIRANADLGVRFEDTTFACPDDDLLRPAKKIRILNLVCTDISKEKVDENFGKVFGYRLSVDPRTHSRYIRKSNINTAHDGLIMDVPSQPETGFVYQAVINNRYGNFVKDARVPVINGVVPFIYYNYKKIDDRFGHPAVSELVETASEFSRPEVERITKFASLMGLDVGELDILRDRDSGKIYVVDVNNTPYGAPLKKSDRKKALAMLSDLFRDSYLT